MSAYFANLMSTLMTDLINKRARPGDAITYTQNVRGGYGWDTFWIPGRLVAYTRKRVTIEIDDIDGVTHRISVAPDRVRKAGPPV